MPSTDLLVSFFVTTAVFAFIPGPSMLYAAARTMAGGRRSGMLAALGIHVGCYLHIVIAAAGLSVLFHAVPLLYGTVKLAGAAYLIWLGVVLFRSKRRGESSEPRAAPKSGRRAFGESMAVEMLNPKTALFFLALLPQFVDPTAPLSVSAQSAIMGIIVNAMFTVADLACVVLAAFVMARMRHSTAAQRWMQRVGGTVLIGLGAHVALQRS